MKNTAEKMKRKGISHFIFYLATVGIAVLSVIQSQENILPEIVGILIYILAAVSLTGAIICLYKDLRSGIIEKFLTAVKRNSFGAHFLEDYRFRTVLTTMPSFVINVAYTIYNGVIGVMNQSAWFITMAVYYSLLGVMRYFAVHTEKKNIPYGGSEADPKKGAGSDKSGRYSAAGPEPGPERRCFADHCKRNSKSLF